MGTIRDHRCQRRDQPTWARARAAWTERHWEAIGHDDHIWTGGQPVVPVNRSLVRSDLDHAEILPIDHHGRVTIRTRLLAEYPLDIVTSL